MPLCLLVLFFRPVPARAWDPATTHAGLTQNAAVASGLHRALTRRLGRPLGLLEPLQLQAKSLDPDTRRGLIVRLEALDPEGGYRPDGEGTATAIGWLVAGSVLAKVPPERGRHHFFDPKNQSGLDDAPGLAGVTHSLRLALDGVGSLRGLFTGTTFNLRGRSALEWVGAAENDLSVPAFFAHLEQAVVAPSPAERELGLVRALLALGGVLTVLEDMGEPAHVRNDFRAAYFKSLGPSPWSKGSPLEALAAARYGRVGVPAPAKPVSRPTVLAYFSGGDGEGLAERTQRRFFSEGTVPEQVPIDPKTTPYEVARAARESLPYPEPRVPRLELRDPGKRHYVVVDGRRVLAYERGIAAVHFGLDTAVHADTAKVLLPEIGAYAAGLIDFLLRAQLTIERAAGASEVRVKIEGLRGTPRDVTVRVVAEDRAGQRTAVTAPAATASALAQGLSVAVPAGAAKVAVAVRGTDDGGPFIAVGQVGAGAGE